MGGKGERGRKTARIKKGSKGWLFGLLRRVSSEKAKSQSLKGNNAGKISAQDERRGEKDRTWELNLCTERGAEQIEQRGRKAFEGWGSEI